MVVAVRENLFWSNISSIMTRGEILLPLICLTLLGALIAFSKSIPFLSAGNAPVAVVPAVEGLGAGASGKNPAASQIRPSPQAVVNPRFKATQKSLEVPKIDINAIESSPSSWENPFSPELWQSTGWKFAAQSMRATGAEPSSATFRRPYHKLMFECDILAAEAPGSTWELRLATRNAQVLMSLILSDGRFAVVTTENGLAHVALEKPLTVPLTDKTARQIRVVATGNRIVVSWDGKRFLATEQLAALSGREIVWSIHTSGAAYEISRLRVEGD